VQQECGSNRKQGSYFFTSLAHKNRGEEQEEPGRNSNQEALAAQATSPLPDKVDRNAISQLLADAHFRFLERIRKLKKQIPRFARDDN